jgi:ketosteroid isomerase-like protein
MLRRATLSVWGAWARGDVEVWLAPYAPDCQLKPPDEWTAAGMRSSYSGRAGVREWAADMHDAWERMDVTPLEIVDAGNPVVYLGQIHLRARGSGIEFDYRLGNVIWLERGLIVRELDFADWNEALRAAGVRSSVEGNDRQGWVTSPS